MNYFKLHYGLQTPVDGLDNRNMNFNFVEPPALFP